MRALRERPRVAALAAAAALCLLLVGGLFGAGPGRPQREIDAAARANDRARDLAERLAVQGAELRGERARADGLEQRVARVERDSERFERRLERKRKRPHRRGKRRKR